MSADPIFHIVLHAPEIPQNTGNIGRICACTGCLLHLVKPIGFELDDRHVRRSGMDYWRNIEYRIHENWQDFLAAKGNAPMYLYSTKAKQSYWDAPMEDGAYLVFAVSPDPAGRRDTQGAAAFVLPGRYPSQTLE